MSIDPTEIQLMNPIQQQAIARAAEAMHRPWENILDEGLQPVVNALKSTPTDTQESALDVAKRLGLVGCFEGPSDLSTNPKHMEEFGGNAETVDLG